MELLQDVEQAAAGLRALGITKGDRITVYMPTSPRGDHADAGGRPHRRDPEAFWDRAARQLPWFRSWDRVFEQDTREASPDAPYQPAFRWFTSGRTNLCYNALDHHVANGRGDHPALIYFN